MFPRHCVDEAAVDCREVQGKLMNHERHHDSCCYELKKLRPYVRTFFLSLVARLPLHSSVLLGPKVAGA